MTVQAEDKATSSLGEIAQYRAKESAARTLEAEAAAGHCPKAGDAADAAGGEESFDSKAGMRIASQALLQYGVRYGGQGAIVIALLAIIGYAGYWSLTEMRLLPALMNKLAQPFVPAPPAKPTAAPTLSKGELEKIEKAEKEKARLAALPKKHHRHVTRPVPPRNVDRRGYAPFSDNPTGGQIIYQDSMITEYRWNK